MADDARQIWKIRIDTGGTFTDCRALPPNDTSPHLVKLLSSGKLRVAVSGWIDADAGQCRVELPASWRTPDGFFVGFAHRGNPVTAWHSGTNTLTFAQEIPHPRPSALDLSTGEHAPVIGVRLLTGTAPGTPFPPLELRLATTRGTNALLEHKGAKVAFFTTRGFGDLLHIRDQRRSDLFALKHHRPEPIAAAFIEVDERLDADGLILNPLDVESLNGAARQAFDRGCDSAAVALLHSYRNPLHECALRDHLLKLGFHNVSLSSELAPLIKILPRAETTVINATLTPVMKRFIDDISAALGPDAGMLTMTSAGGLEEPTNFHPKDSLFSGPAGGVVGAAAAGRQAGFDKLITFDMGGTSTDVARYDGDFMYQFEQRIGDATLLAPALKIATVAAGGGSICSRDDSGLRVGPESAGADPGPACYGRGGPLTITDVNLLLERIDPDNFGIPLGPENLQAARCAALELQAEGDSIDAKFLEGLLEIAIEQMADSIREISIREGADPADYALLAFGGAGPLHACAIAERLGIATVLVPAEAGILSAFGLHHAVVERFSERQILQSLDAISEQLADILAQMARQAADGIDADRVEIRRRIAELRLAGQDATLPVEIDVIADIAADFRERYANVFGYRPDPQRPIELVALRVAVSTPAGDAIDSSAAVERSVDGRPWSAAMKVPGPARIQDPFSTCWIAEGWSACAGPDGGLVITRQKHHQLSRADQPALIQHELFRHRFGAIVEEMGAMLERSAVSTNVKERLDFSCALLDADGRLVVNAPHIPVHLGALGECVRRVTRVHEFRPGDMIVTNHPGFGGSHLPDVTVISAVFGNDGKLVAYIANRAHHAEIGGISPGSMPPAATCLAEEGVVIEPTLLFDRGESKLESVATLLTESPYPTRHLADNLADLNAQAAANRSGAEALRTLLDQHGGDAIESEFTHLASAATDALQTQITASGFQAATAEQRLDDGTLIKIHAQWQDGRLRIDFSGTAECHPGNLNATPAIVKSALLYVLRLWIGGSKHLPLNEGLLSHIDLIQPRSFLNPDFPDDAQQCPAVVGGNVETSQRLVDALIQLFGLQAASQGTMNNFIFGADDFGYYETIGGGAGAGPDYDGASGLHTHMTNTSITDPEILENRYPVRLRRFSFRPGSGGRGEHNGGDGLIREIEFLRELDVSLLTQNRTQGATGMSGGEPGKPGRQILTRAQSASESLASIAAFHASPGAVLRIETPGGGGWGNPAANRAARP